jgi:ketosteroid isomerase-like protein
MRDESFETTVHDVGRAAGAFVGGDPAPMKAHWAQREDVTIFGGWGAYEVGWDQVGPRLDWAGARFDAGGWTRQEVMASGSSGDLGYTVSLERGEARLAGRDEAAPMLLRVTHVYRRVDGDWKLVHRHADAVVDKTPPAAVLRR